MLCCKDCILGLIGENGSGKSTTIRLIMDSLNDAKIVNEMMKHTYKNWDEKKYYQYLKQFNLPEKKKFKEFSRGMKMKLAIAVALSHDPKLLVLDEATSGLIPLCDFGYILRVYQRAGSFYFNSFSYYQ